MKEWPRIKTRIGGMRKRRYIQRKYLPEKILLDRVDDEGEEEELLGKYLSILT